MSSTPRKNLLQRLRDELRLPPFPRWGFGAGAILVVASWIPLVLIAKARNSKSPDPRIHIIQDMDAQARYNPQSENTLFADERAMRPKILGTVAHGRLEEDDHFYRGYTRVWDASTKKYEIRFFDSFPEQVKVNQALLRRGQQQFAIFCAPCHGLDGQGNGAVHVRVQGRESAWVPPSNLMDETPRSRPVGHLFNTIGNGIRNMAGYGAQIPPADRWAIVAYVKTLQFSRNAPASLVPDEKQSELRNQ